ncbi:hypothetical protein [Lactiplantibacillus pentosus]|uniref:Uncharacterized protein n=1 Tax=Lactiplantibacillus pentosus TaxID=1589 RepID=A0AB37RKY7_LACPE|nr:hypothetical protein [Lactiplantibacillus pentosus]MCT3311246.1 hypothetical protein [Lactiplantibacillus pentosus]RMW44601.1 hypothetical protein D6U20_09830 [Lactiplantibacillus pentosus]RMW48901.1 hypothetical protein D6U19_02715 [Lactiplantibacillus pentosus]RMW57094.1 hypothetical protein D6U17_01635 [Lactiplantibacillus pentosus]RMW57594.1 hypothetical protein D6U21_00895 [Lactiplantibacillus pentosus]
MDPDFVKKIMDGNTEQIINTTTIENLEEAGLPTRFIENYADKNGAGRMVSYRNGIPLPGLD